MPSGDRTSIWPGTFHAIFRITSTRTGQQWYLDLAGGQYGIYQSFWKAEAYNEAFLRSVVRLYPASTNKTLVAKLAAIKGIRSINYGIVGQAAMKLDAAAEAWISDHFQLSKLLDMSVDEFEMSRTSLLKAMYEAVRRYIQAGTYLPMVRAAKIYMATHPEESEEEADAVEWLASVNLLPAQCYTDASREEEALEMALSLGVANVKLF